MVPSAEAMQYATVEEGRALGGIRLVLSIGAPAGWSQAAKSIFYVKGLSYTPVGQMPGDDNAALLAWTGFRNAPLAIYNDERPLDRWLDILMLAERLSPQPALLPQDVDHRSRVIGLSHEICGEWGLGWCRRAEALGASINEAGASPLTHRMIREYGVTSAVCAAASGRIAEILHYLAHLLREQHRAGRRYLVGGELTALDIYWATFATILEPLPQDLCPMAEWERALFSACSPTIAAAKDPALFEHRDFIYATHLQLPVQF